MTVNFPSIHPTTCSFTPPEWSITESRSQSGVRSYRIWANKPSDALLDLGFDNISETNAFAISQSYVDARGPIEDLILPSILFSGIGNTTFIDIFSQANSGLAWHFIVGEPPVVERVPGRRYSVKVRLRAELRF
jgi:hypothetical protein